MAIAERSLAHRSAGTDGARVGGTSTCKNCRVSPDRDAEQLPPGLLLPAGVTAAEFTRQAAQFPDVPVETSPPGDMPPAALMILDSLADDAETIYTMRNCGDMAPYGVALIGESHLLESIRSLLHDGQIEVHQEHTVINGRLLVRPPRGEVATTDDDLRRFWFRMTPAGEATWQQASDVLDAYRDAHPLQLADAPQ